MFPRRAPANLFLAAGSTVFALLLIELALRVVLPPPIHFRYPQESYAFDPQIAHVLQPDQRAFTHDQAVVTNSHGLRDRDFAERPEPGVLRVLAVGDSQTFGNGLALADTWPKQLEGDLNRLGAEQGARFEVVNGGISDSDTWQQVRTSLAAMRRECAGRGDALFIPWDGHNSAVANAVIAERIARELLPLAKRGAGR